MTVESAMAPAPHDAAALWLVQRVEYASSELSDCIERNPLKMNGVPVVKGSRISVAQILAEIAEGMSADEVAEDFSLDPSLVKRLVSGLSVCLDRPLSQ
jgi:uncharacterized protein (DUF433 family)